MVLSYSVIIPARNAARTLGACLESITGQTPAPLEVIVVNDASGDGTRAVAERFPCTVIDVEIGLGPMRPRFAGARRAGGAILVFTDADVKLPQGTLERLLKHFEDAAVSAVTGILSAGGAADFFSAYKNEYMNYIFRRQPRRSRFLYGSFWAVRRSDMLFFEPVTDPFGDLVSDSEMGFRLKAAGKEILLDRELQVEHLKRYGFLSLLANDFRIPFMFARLFCACQSRAPRISGGRFSHASWMQTAAAGLAFLGFACAAAAAFRPGFLAAAGVCLSLFYAYWSPFLYGLRRRGLSFLACAAAFTWLDGAVMFVGMVSGFVYSAAAVLRRRPDKSGMAAGVNSSTDTAR